MTDPDPQDPGPRGPRSGVSRRRFLQGAAGGAAFLVGAPILRRVPPAQAAQSNPVVAENALGGSTAFQLAAGRYNGSVNGFSTKPSVNRGEVLKVRLNDWNLPYQGPNTQATLQIYRLGYYGGAGGRLVSTQTVPLRNQGFLDEGRPLFDDYGFASAAFRWTDIVDVPTADLLSGVYLAKLIPSEGTPRENHFPFIVREDARDRDILLVMPTNTWSAYNSWPGKCLYVGPDYRSDYVTMAGTDSNNGGKSRALKVSFDRPHNNVYDDLNWLLRTEFPLIYWLEQQGYDVAYTEDVALDAASAGQLRAPRTKTLAFAGHAEYWTQDMFDKVIEARNAGTNIASFSANAAYWKVRYEDGRRTMVCFKTVQGRNADATDLGKDGINDFGPGADARGGPADPLGPSGQQGGADDDPEFATTTFRDGGATPGSANAPDGVAPRAFEGRGRVGPDRPENELWGVMYVGDHDVVGYPLQVPAGVGSGGEFGAHRAWRHTSLGNGAGAQIGENLVGWEWDSIPSATTGVYNRFVSRQPAGVKRLAQTNPRQIVQDSVPAEVAGSMGYLQDEGRAYGHGNKANPASPPGNQPPEVHAVTYTAPSGALVFAAGTMQWSFGLGPYFESLGTDRTYESPRVDGKTQPVIQQATYNVLADGGVTPATPVGIVLDAPPAPPAPGQPAAPDSQPPPTSSGPKVTPKKRTKPPRVRIPRNRRRMRRDGTIRMRVTLPKSQRSGAFAALALEGKVFRTAKAGRKRKPRRVALGDRVVDLSAGQSKLLALELSPRHQRMLRRRGHIRVVVTVRVFDRSGNEGRSRLSFRLDEPRPRRRRARASRRRRARRNG